MNAILLKEVTPGLCVASEDGPGISQLIAFGRKCTSQVVTQKEALEASSPCIFQVMEEPIRGSSAPLRQLG